jgi:hypothetical protein
VAAISKEHPVLSLGVSVEKGLEGSAASDPREMMDRHAWDWPRLVENLSDVLLTDVPELARGLEAPVHVRVRRGARWDADKRWWKTRGFSFVNEQWFERHAGRVHVDTETVVEHVRELDDRKDLWAIVTITHDLGSQSHS